MRQEVGNDELLISPRRPVAVPHDVNDLGVEQNRAVVVEDPAVGPRRTRSGWTAGVWTEGVLRRGGLQRGQDERKSDRDESDELRFHGGSPSVWFEGFPAA